MKPTEDDQKYFHYIYINETLRIKHNIKLDHYSELVINVMEAFDELEFHCKNGTLRNVSYAF